MNNEKTPSKALAYHIYEAGEKAQKYWSLASAIYSEFNPIAIMQTLIGEYNIPESAFKKGWGSFESVHKTSIELSNIIINNK